ncbi:S8 family serine peptidase [Bradyrhizobium japonicum]|uniref:S8 family serine peptidase n=1 Tax=Bradyrhizobium japonicum TaxID=375 RepID=UPI001BAAD8EE|nr:S8 family serine peptidase [Bradyrhizobium japonicum]MBR0911493.1 S8 family serine peptidase [Bradyrhizobium japonicum]
MSEIRNLVETILYGGGSHRRFTQDGPVLPDVWTKYLEEALKEGPDDRIAVLLEPHFDSTPALVSQRMKEQLKDRFEFTQTVYNRTVVSSWLNLVDLVLGVIPLTRWYSDIADGRDFTGARKPIFDGLLPRKGQIWDDQLRQEREGYPFPKLLAFVRIAGIIAQSSNDGIARSDIRADLLAAVAEIRSFSDEDTSRSGRDRIADLALKGWNLLLGGRLPDRAVKARRKDQGSISPIYAINRNREVRFALTHSVKTVKADAANRLFEVDCKSVTWAIIDSGIDATHPAFIDQADFDARGLAPQKRAEDIGRLSEIDRLKTSRVIETYDFGYLEDLLLGRREALPERYRLRDSRYESSYLKEIATRIKRSRAIDWELLKPFLRIEHDETYLASKPTDGHGTHVAGILGADWARGGDERLQGMCPQIRLIDIRITGYEGRSSEFIIMSALQFLRYLNANADRQRIHGVNLSLSLLHEAATYACGQTPICEEAENTVASGVVVVAAAGNLGYRRFSAPNSEPFDQYCPVSITDPGNAESVITVGSTHRIEPYNYGVSYFSSRGPTGDGRIKPDLVAPGEKIFAPTLEGSAMRLDGTSMAAPHVSGAAAMLMARNVELKGNPARIKRILCDTASDLGRERYFQGYGLLDVLRALQSI